MSLEIWMRENPLTYIWIGSYGLAFAIFAIEIAMVVHKRKLALQQARLMLEAAEEE